MGDNEFFADLIKISLTSVFTLAAGAVAWFVKWRKDKRREPTEEAAAVISITNDLQALARAGVAEVRADMEALRAEYATQRAEDAAQATREAAAAKAEAEAQVERLEALLVDAQEQSELAGRLLTESQKQTQIARENIRVLLAHIRVLDDWAQRYYAADHPPGMERPPKLIGFQTA